MAALTTMLLSAGLALSAVGTGTAIYGQHQAAKAQGEALQEQQKAETLRQQMANVDADRRRREVVRQSIAARSQALASANADGGTGQGSSLLPGAYGGISGQSTTNMNTINENQQAGDAMFGINRNMLGDYRAAASAGAVGAMGSSLTSLGGAILNNIGSISRIGTFLGPRPNYDTYAAGGMT